MLHKDRRVKYILTQNVEYPSPPNAKRSVLRRGTIGYGEQVSTSGEWVDILLIVKGVYHWVPFGNYRPLLSKRGELRERSKRWKKL